MEIKQIEKIAKAYDKIKVKHEEIVKLNKIAETTLKSEKGIDLSISIDKIKEPKKEDVLDSDGSLKNDYEPISIGMYGTFFSSQYLKDEYKENTNKVSLDLNLDDLTSLEIIGVLIQKKEAEIKILINSLNS